MPAVVPHIISIVLRETASVYRSRTIFTMLHFHSSNFKSIVFVCAVIGVLQSGAWVALTVCAILTFRCVLPTPQYASDHVVATTIVKLYFEGDGCKVEGFPPGCRDIFTEVGHIEPIQVFSWMIAFSVISSIQLIASIFLFKRRSGEFCRSVLRDWCFITFLASAMDAGLFGTFVSDYIAFKEYLEAHAMKDEEGIAAAPVVMFIIAARGFGLWIMNAGFLLYFSIFLVSTSREAEFSGGGGKKEGGAAVGVVNRAFATSSESPVCRDREGRDLSSYDATQEITFYPVTREQRRFSVSSFEAVTRFNEEEYEGNGGDKNGESKRDRGRFECNCEKWADKQDGVLQSQWRNNLYHSHGCPALRSELERKLATVRDSEERVFNKANKLTDFSHDLRNFKPGGGKGSGKAKASTQRAWIPEAPPIPAAATCNNSDFY